MRHGKKHAKLNRTSSHRQAMFKNMAISLITHGAINTTLPKAKALRPYFEKLVTKAKRQSLATTRALTAELLNNHEAVSLLINQVAQKAMNRPGGYTRIYKTGFRQGDNAPTAMIELVDMVSSEAKQAN